jgi:hypothetical protein
MCRRTDQCSDPYHQQTADNGVSQSTVVAGWRRHFGEERRCKGSRAFGEQHNQDPSEPKQAEGYGRG